MKSAARYRRFLRRAESSPAYWRELAVIEFVADITAAMKKQGITRAALAKRLGTSAPYVTQTLRGDGNLTLETLVRFAMAVGGVVHVHIADRDVATRWIDEPRKDRASA